MGGKREGWLIDARTLASRPTGIGMYAYRLIRQMLAEQGDAVRMVLVCDVKASEEIRTLEESGCEVREYGRRVYNSVGVVGYFRWVRRVVREVRPEVFWQPNNLQPFRIKDVPRVIVTMHDVFGLGWSWRYALWHLYYRWNFRRTLENVTEVWYNSEQTRREVRAKAGRGGLGEGADWVERITHPIAEVPLRSAVEAYRWERPYLLYLGNVETRKGADLLFAAYRAARSSGGSVRTENLPDLIVAGSVRNVQVVSDAHIVHLGYVDERTKWALLKGCVALVVPSRAEGYGMQVAEAVTFGTRVVASDLPVFREVEAAVGKAAGQGSVVYLRGFCEGSDEERVRMLNWKIGQIGK